MRRLTSAYVYFARELRREDGLSFALAAVTMVALIGMVAFAVDVGAIYAERRELQNGATAAALAIAEDCARGLPCDSGTANVTADTYADANARDGAAGIYALSLDTVNKTVSVTTNTEDVGGATVLAPFFAQVVGYAGDTVGATAEAEWGFAGAAYGIPPLLISECEWINATPPQLALGDPVVITFHDGNATDDCAAQAGQDWDGDTRLPGGFGWALANGSAPCTMDIPRLMDWVAFEDPGASPSTGCDASTLRNLLFNPDGIVLPYFTDVRGLGAGGEYYVQALGGFMVTGYNFGGQYKEPSAATAPCSGDERCIAGYVTDVNVPLSEIGGEDRGAISWGLTG